MDRAAVARPFRVSNKVDEVDAINARGEPVRKLAKLAAPRARAYARGATGECGMEDGRRPRRRSWVGTRADASSASLCLDGWAVGQEILP
jgi:hypothetical protein